MKGEYLDDLKYGYKVISSFCMETDDEIAKFFDGFLKFLVECSKKEAKGIVINAQSNGGGLETLGRVYIYILYTYQFPLLGRNDITINDLSKLFIDDDILDYYNNSVKLDITKEENQKNITETRNSTTRTRLWSKY